MSVTDEPGKGCPGSNPEAGSKLMGKVPANAAACASSSDGATAGSSQRQARHIMSGARHRRQRPEAAIHAAVCDHLRLRAKPDVLWLHPANGGTRDIREAARFKRMGVLAGASDLLFWHRGNSFALELKSPGGRLSDAQLEFLARWGANVDKRLSRRKNIAVMWGKCARLLRAVKQVTQSNQVTLSNLDKSMRRLAFSGVGYASALSRTYWRRTILRTRANSSSANSDPTSRRRIARNSGSSTTAAVVAGE
jgi:hypothetical protein